MPVSSDVAYFRDSTACCIVMCNNKTIGYKPYHIVEYKPLNFESVCPCERITYLILTWTVYQFSAISGG